MKYKNLDFDPLFNELVDAAHKAAKVGIKLYFVQSAQAIKRATNQLNSFAEYAEAKLLPEALEGLETMSDERTLIPLRRPAKKVKRRHQEVDTGMSFDEGEEEVAG